MPGGRRNGRPGAAYPERTDLNGPNRTTQPIQTAPGQPYGQAKEQADAQHVIPLPQSQPMALPTPIPAGAPTQNPDEHVMAGSPRGPGAGPEAIQPPPVNLAPQAGNADVLSQLQALLQLSSKQPGGVNPGLINLIDSIKSGDYNRGGIYGKAIGQ